MKDFALGTFPILWLCLAPLDCEKNYVSGWRVNTNTPARTLSNQPLLKIGFKKKKEKKKEMNFIRIDDK